ncbi:hypothetical protein Smlt2785 [Stenotrophomonas maltophilia K279a]|uniref:Uncharacterized protein n=2 Tax=Lysobacteraceae TaxID=32033 RepID=B2FUM3_STRMK|nr:hypothetical protein Smlt2785 [Stenotrophomonas maltophilia K279a]
MGAFAPTGLGPTRIRTTYRPPLLWVAATDCPARSLAMNESDFPHLHAYRSTAGDDGSPQAAPTVDRNTFIANLHRIGSGAAADGQPWPERHQLPGRCLALADADCALSGLRVVLEMLLAAERTRQNGEPEEYVGDRVMEGLVMACQSLCAQAVGRLQPEG